MYENDSFFTLTAFGRIGLVCLSAAMAIATVWLFLWISRGFSIPVRVMTAIVFLWLFTWLSPQIYYFYYMLLFDFLEFKIIPQLPPGPIEIFQLLTFTEDFNFSKHGKGVLGWILIFLAVKPLWKTIPTRDQDR